MRIVVVTSANGGFWALAEGRVCLIGLTCVCFREVRQSGVTFHGSDHLPGQRTWSVRQHAECSVLISKDG